MTSLPATRPTPSSVGQSNDPTLLGLMQRSQETATCRTRKPVTRQLLVMQLLPLPCCQRALRLGLRLGHLSRGIRCSPTVKDSCFPVCRTRGCQPRESRAATSPEGPSCWPGVDALHQRAGAATLTQARADGQSPVHQLLTPLNVTSLILAGHAIPVNLFS